MTKKDYPNSDVIERAYIVWLFHNKDLRERYLSNTLPAVFLHPSRRLLIYVMQKLQEQSIEITVSNIALYMQNSNESLKSFLKKHKAKVLLEEDIQDMVTDMEITNDLSLFDLAKDWLVVYAFARFVEDRSTDIKWWNSYAGEYEPHILAACRGVIKVYDMLHNRLSNKRDQLVETMELINSSDEYISTSSQVLNSFIGGWTKGYIGTIIAKSGHTKSSWADYDTVHSLMSKKITSAIIISPEEAASTRWRRIIAMVFKIPTSMMRQKTMQVSEEHIKKIREMFKDKLIIYDEVTKYKDIIDLMGTVKADKLVVDHLQSIEYPGNKDYLSNMIGNIPGIIDFEKRLAKARKMAIINLSQVNDKEIQRSERLSKAPRYYDAYGSSVLYQGSREFLSLYYPIRDYEDNPIIFGKHIPSINDIQVSVEKSSFSRLGKMHMHFDPEFNTFTDKSTKSLEKGDYIPPKEKSIDQIGMFE